jgi:hypothetical protein
VLTTRRGGVTGAIGIGPRRTGRTRTWLAALLAALCQLSCETPPASTPPATEAASAPTQTRQVPAPPIAPAATAAPAGERYDLERDEARGGHTLARHVGRSDADLEERLRREPRISAASTYPDRITAERVVARTLARQRGRVERWLARAGPRPNLALDYRGDKRESIGRSLSRRSSKPVVCADAVVVLRSDGRRGFIVLTSYPEASR